jgi:serine/threonine-protein kinase RsbW
VAAALARLGYPGGDVFGVRVALEEAIVNGLRHGNANDPAKGVRVRCYVGPEVMLAEVEDEGPGFDPARLEKLAHFTGRGLVLMRQYLSWVQFSGRGNHVTLCKRRSR